VALTATDGSQVSLAKLPGRVVVFAYPRTGEPGKPSLVGDWDIYATEVGDPPKLLGKSSSPDLAYEPWTSGTYWLLACKPDYCFVMFSTVHVVF